MLLKQENGITKPVAGISSIARLKPQKSKRRRMDIHPAKFAIARVHHQLIALTKAPAPGARQLPKKVHNVNGRLVRGVAIVGSISNIN